MIFQILSSSSMSRNVLFGPPAGNRTLHCPTPLIHGHYPLMAATEEKWAGFRVIPGQPARDHVLCGLDTSCQSSSSGDIGRSTAGTAPERYSSEYTPPRRDGCTSVGAPRVPGPQSSLILPDEAETADLGQRDADQCKAIAQLQVLSVNPVEMPAADVGPCDNREPQAPAHMRQHVCRIRCVIVQCFFHRCCI